MAFEQLTLRQQRDLVRVVLCRADAWLDWEDHPVDRRSGRLREIFGSIGGLFVRPRRRGAAAPPQSVQRGAVMSAQLLRRGWPRDWARC